MNSKLLENLLVKYKLTNTTSAEELSDFYDKQFNELSSSERSGLLSVICDYYSTEYGVQEPYINFANNIYKLYSKNGLVYQSKVLFTSMTIYGFISDFINSSHNTTVLKNSSSIESKIFASNKAVVYTYDNLTYSNVSNEQRLIILSDIISDSSDLIRRILYIMKLVDKYGIRFIRLCNILTYRQQTMSWCSCIYVVKLNNKYYVKYTDNRINVNNPYSAPVIVPRYIDLSTSRKVRSKKIMSDIETKLKLASTISSQITN